MLRLRCRSVSPLTRELQVISWPLRAPLGVIFTPSGEMATVYSLPSRSSSRLIDLSSFVAIPPSVVGGSAAAHKSLYFSVSLPQSRQVYAIDGTAVELRPPAGSLALEYHPKQTGMPNDREARLKREFAHKYPGL